MSTSPSKAQKNSYFMNLALNQAKFALGKTSENPAVGCVIVKNDCVISAGFTGTGGRPHAEQNAILLSKKNTRNTSIYVTLEPCSHYGKTPPCTKTIAKKGIKKVFFSINDPDLRSKNKCSQILRVKNISVNKGVCSSELKQFYKSYIKSKKSLIPFVTCKMALSKDFFIINKKDKWITNQFSRGRVHLMRSNHDCVMTSSKTVINDNPKLTCRIKGLESSSPSRIILDKNLSIPITSNVIRESMRYRTIIFYNKYNHKKLNMLKKQKIEFVKIPLDINYELDLYESLIKAKELGFYRIFLESGIKLASSFLSKNLVDELSLFISNKKLKKDGKNNIKKQLDLFLSGKEGIIENVNLLGDKLVTYIIK